MPSPEDQARENIDRMLTKSGWAVRGQNDAHISAYRGLAIRNFTLKQGHGFADYLLYVDGRAAGVVEAKKEGVTLTGVETQSEKQEKPRFDPQDLFRAAWLRRQADRKASFPSYPLTLFTIHPRAWEFRSDPSFGVSGSLAKCI